MNGLRGSLISLCLLMASSLSAQVQNNNAPWEMFAARLTAQIKGTATAPWPGLQLVPIPMDARWDDPALGNYYAWHLLGDMIPKWGVSYSPTQRLITDEYGLFIKSIELPLADPKQRANAEKARKQWNKALAEQQAAARQLATHWKTFDADQQALPPNRRTGFDAWYSQYDGKTLAALHEKADAAALQYVSYAAKTYKGNAFAATFITNYDNEAFQLETPSPDGIKLKYRTYNISPDLGQWIATSKKMVADNAPPSMSWEFKRDTGRRHTEDESMGGSFSWFGFLGVSGGTSRHSVDTNREGFHMRFEARNLGQFTISPGRWFSGTAVMLFKDGPFAQGAVIDPKKLWGEKGSFNLLPTTLIVAFRPKLTASLTSEEYHYLKQSWAGGGGFSIGPFSFGASANKTVENITWDDASNTVTAETQSDVPQILAIISDVLPNSD